MDVLIVRGHDVTIIDNFSNGRAYNLEHIRNKINIVECDISKLRNWQDLFVDVKWVFHLATLADIVPSIGKPHDYFHYPAALSR